MPEGWWPNPSALMEILIGSQTDPADEDFTSAVASLLALVKGTSSRAARIETLISSDFLAVPNVVSFSDVDNSVVFEVRLVDKETGPVPSAQITPGTIQISRWRAGVEQSIVAATPFLKAAGRIYYAYTFAAASWARDDTSVATPAGVSFVENLGTIDKGTIIKFFDNTLALPVNPVEGDKYIALVTAHGWTKDYIYTYTGGVWVGVAPATGFYVANADDGLRYWFNGAAWALGTITRYPAIPPWFTALQDVSTLEGKVDAIQTDLGDPSARTNLKSIEAMLGMPDTAGMSAWSQIKALNALAIGAGNVPTAGTIADVLHKDGSYTYSKTTDSLEATRDALDAAQLALETRIGTPVAASISADIAVVDGIVDDIVQATVMPLSSKVYMCTLASQISALAIGSVAADLSFPSVVIPASAVPSGATLVAAYLVIYWRKQKDSSGAANAISAANKSIRIKAAAGAWGTNDIIALTFADGALNTDANNTEGSPLVIGTIDISSVVTGAGTYNVRSEQTNRLDALVVTAASLTLYDVAVGIQLVTKPAYV